MYNAEIGRWDTPYPGQPAPSCGPFRPDLEPDGNSIFTVAIDVQCGGLLTFTYNVTTYDVGDGPDTDGDPLTISLVTSTGTTTLLGPFGQPLPPDHCYGHYWESGRHTISKNLTPWANQQVQVEFSLYQNGWGDQTRAWISSLAVRSCSVPPLTPLSNDPQTQSLEANPVDETHLTPNMQNNLNCLRNAVAAAGGVLTVSSAYRTPELQAHLREVWEKWRELRDNDNPECQETRTAVQNEFGHHQFDPSMNMPPARSTGPHTQGAAFDANWSGITTGILDQLAAQCGLRRPFPGPRAPLQPHLDTHHFTQ